MKKIRYTLWVAAILMIGLVFIQNQALYSTQQSLSLNLLLFDIALPPLPNGAILLFFFLSGILLAAGSNLAGRFKTRSALKRCNATGDGSIEKIGALKTQLEQMKSRSMSKTAFKPSFREQAEGGDHVQGPRNGARSLRPKEARHALKCLSVDEHINCDDITVGEIT